MPGVSIVSKLVYIGKESVPGTRVPPNKYLQSLNMRILPVSTRGTVRGSGSLLASDRPLIQEYATFSLEGGSYLDYNSCVYPLAGMLGNPTISTPGGATLAREHLFTFDPSGSNVRPTFTLSTGYRGGTAEECVRGTWQTFNFGFTRTGDPTIGGDGYARTPDFAAALGTNELVTITPSGTWSGGTYTLSFGAQTTAGIAYNAPPATAKAAFELLSTVGSGNTTFGGAALSTGPMTISFSGGALANTDVGAVTISTASVTGGGTAAVVVTQAGGTTTVPVVSVQAPQWDVYLDPTYGAIGTTKVDVYSGAFSFGGLTNMEWVVNSAQTSFRGDILQVPTVTANLVLSNDSTARALYAALRTGAHYFVRFQATGNLIEASQSNLLRLDMAVAGAENMAQFGDEGGAETLPIPLTVISDSTFTAGIQALVRNAVVSL